MMTTHADPILQLENIRKSYTSIVAVRDLTLTVPRGCIYGLIGPNGAGKTTTIRMLMNIIGTDAGSIRYNFQDSSADPVDRIGYLPEERGLYKKMTVGEVLVFLAEIKSVPPKVSKERVGHWLERVGLSDWRTKKVQELSKGMQQKLQFVSTVLHEPELLVLDELFSGLDPVNMEMMKDIVLQLREQGTTILFSTHVMEQAEKLCDYLCMINGGEKVLDGPLTDVKAKFGGNTLVVTGEFSSQQLGAMTGVESVRSERHSHELTLRPETDRQALIASLLQCGRLDSLSHRQPSLHNIFLTMVGPREQPAETGGASA